MYCSVYELWPLCTVYGVYRTIVLVKYRDLIEKCFGIFGTWVKMHKYKLYCLGALTLDLCQQTKCAVFLFFKT
jgi:hypothetical protein